MMTISKQFYSEIAEYIASYAALNEQRHPSRETIAKHFGISDRTTGNILFCLENKHLIGDTNIDIEIDQDAIALVTYLKKGIRTFEDTCDWLNIAPSALRKKIEALKANNYLVSIDNDIIKIGHTGTSCDPVGLDMQKHGSHDIVIGGIADTHIGSRYERLDVLESIYDRFAAAGVTKVFHGGNWIDGEANFNKQDIYCHGLSRQVDNFISKYPKRDGIVNYILSGDDHEGWYVQREGIDIGSYMQHRAELAGRTDLIDAGYIERDFDLKQADGSATLRLIHAGGGSSYALSYTSQKYAESLTGGEKPQIVLVGHYHKFEYCYPREVHIVQLGTVCDQTPFMRKRKLQAMVGACIIRIKQADNGILLSFSVEWMPYYDKKFYQYKW